MMLGKHQLPTLFIAVMLLAAASAGVAARAASAEAPADVITADDAFGFNLLRALQQASRESNTILSPLSAALDLSMLLEGAEGETRREIQAALSIGGQTPAAINEANANLIKALRTPSPNSALFVADSLWVDDRRATLRSDYLKATRSKYDAKITALDFSDASAPGQINDWVSKATNGKIAGIIDKLDPDDRLLLLNAVYFKGEWAHKFDKSLTQPRDFTPSGGSTKQVPRMAQSGRFDYFETPQLQAVRVPFGNGELVMHILLPAASSNLPTLLAQLTVDQWKSWQGRYAQRAGKLEVPRFELRSNVRLNESLQALGMRRAFRRDAQLALLFSSAGRSGGAFFVSAVRQSTYWKVDEDGSEAAAVTSIGVRAAAVARPPAPFSMIVNRSYFCAIEDRRTGALLFIGAIFDPTA